MGPGYYRAGSSSSLYISDHISSQAVLSENHHFFLTNVQCWCFLHSLVSPEHVWDGVFFKGNIVFVCLGSHSGGVKKHFFFWVYWVIRKGGLRASPHYFQICAPVSYRLEHAPVHYILLKLLSLLTQNRIINYHKINTKSLQRTLQQVIQKLKVGYWLQSQVRGVRQLKLVFPIADSVGPFHALVVGGVGVNTIPRWVSWM